jgi:hypothetical protein
MMYRRRPQPIRAEQWTPDGDPVAGVVGGKQPGVWTEAGFQRIHPGDWVVVDDADRRRVYSDRYFRANFEECP